jgi:hypothetical protein
MKNEILKGIDDAVISKKELNEIKEQIVMSEKYHYLVELFDNKNLVMEY